MPSIFSTQNLQTFLRRKNLRPPSRGPPGPPPGRGLRGPLRSGRSPPLRSGRLSPPLDPADPVGAFVSSAIMLLLSLNSLADGRGAHFSTDRHANDRRATNQVPTKPALRPVFLSPLPALPVSLALPERRLR